MYPKTKGKGIPDTTDIKSKEYLIFLHLIHLSELPVP